jgi:hypothetical protein
MMQRPGNSAQDQLLVLVDGMKKFELLVCLEKKKKMKGDLSRSGTGVRLGFVGL